MEALKEEAAANSLRAQEAEEQLRAEKTRATAAENEAQTLANKIKLLEVRI